MIRTRSASAWSVPVVIGVLAGGVFVALLVSSPTVRHYWPLLLLSAAAAASPFLVSGPRSSGRALPMTDPTRAAGPGNDADAVPGLTASAVSVAKAAASENEDAFGIDTDTGYLAVADGASSSFRAAEWSRLLCATFLEQRPLAATLSTSWITRSADDLRAASSDGSASWWATDADERGAHAAFVGLAVVRQDRRLIWRATAIGDCVLAHLRPVASGEAPIVTTFPIAHSSAFPANPTLLSSSAKGLPPVSYLEGSAAIGDIWLLMTDELAKWALRSYEDGYPTWSLLADGTEDEIISAIRNARSTPGVADDDMTVVRCKCIGLPAD